jgi:hypothetical protein
VRKGLDTLDPDQPPADFGSAWWRDLIRDAERFLPVWGRQAADLGWSMFELFGVHRLAPAARYSCMGCCCLSVTAGSSSTAGSAVMERQWSAPDLHATTDRSGVCGGVGVGQRTTLTLRPFRLGPAVKVTIDFGGLGDHHEPERRCQKNCVLPTVD